LIIFIQLYWNLCGSGYNAKSFKINCFVVTFAIFTVLYITGYTIYWIDKSIAWFISILKLILSEEYCYYSYLFLKIVFLLIILIGYPLLLRYVVWGILKCYNVYIVLKNAFISFLVVWSYFNFYYI